jgi:FkbM family methyltransferase
MSQNAFLKIGRIFRKIISPEKEKDLFLNQATGVIHIGANSGQERKLYARHDLDVLWIEPNPKVFKELQKNIDNLKKQKAFQYLISDDDKDDVNFHISSNDGQSSSLLELGDHKSIWPEVQYISTITLESCTFKTFIEREEIDYLSYNTLVLDTQGAELMVLRGAGELVKNFTFIKTEAADFDSYIGCCKIDDLSSHLKKFNFKEVGRWKFANSENKNYFDILFKRTI